LGEWIFAVIEVVGRERPACVAQTVVLLLR